MGIGNSQHCTELQFLDDQNKNNFLQTLCHCPQENLFFINKDILTKFKDTNNFVLITEGESTQAKLWQSEKLFVCAISISNPPLQLNQCAFNRYHSLPFISIYLDPLVYYHMCYFMNKVRFYIGREEFLNRILLCHSKSNSQILKFVLKPYEKNENILPPVEIINDFRESFHPVSLTPFSLQNENESVVSISSAAPPEFADESASSIFPFISSPGDTDVSEMASKSLKRIKNFQEDLPSSTKVDISQVLSSQKKPTLNGSTFSLSSPNQSKTISSDHSIHLQNNSSLDNTVGSDQDPLHIQNISKNKNNGSSSSATYDPELAKIQLSGVSDENSQSNTHPSSKAIITPKIKRSLNNQKQSIQGKRSISKRGRRGKKNRANQRETKQPIVSKKDEKKPVPTLNSDPINIESVTDIDSEQFESFSKRSNESKLSNKLKAANVGKYLNTPLNVQKIEKQKELTTYRNNEKSESKQGSELPIFEDDDYNTSEQKEDSSCSFDDDILPNPKEPEPVMEAEQKTEQYSNPKKTPTITTTVRGSRGGRRGRGKHPKSLPCYD